MPAKDLKSRWNSNSYANCYCYPRKCKSGTMVYTVVKGKRLGTGLIWNNNNKNIALRILDDRADLEFNRFKNVSQIRTVGELLGRFLEYANSIKQKDTFRKYKNAIKCFDIISITDYNLKDIGQFQIYIEKQTVKLLNEYSCHTIHRHLTAIKSIFQFGIEQKLIFENPIIKKHFPKCQKKEFQEFKDSDVRCVINYFKEKEFNIMMSLIIEFILITGVRIGELTKIKISDVKDHYILISGKGDVNRKFPLSYNSNLNAIIQKALLLTDNELLFKYTSQQPLAKKLKDCCLELGFKDKTKIEFHQIRKLAENRMIKIEGIPNQLVADMLGHSIATQQKHYAEITKIDEYDKYFNSV